MAESAQMEQLWELQTRTTELRRHVVQLTAQLASAEKERQILAVTLCALEALPEGTRTYRAVGRMFALNEGADLRRDLESSAAESEKQSATKTALRDQFASKLKDAEAQAEQLAAAMKANPAFMKPLASK